MILRLLRMFKIVRRSLKEGQRLRIFEHKF